MSGSLEAQERQGPYFGILISSSAFFRLVPVLVFLNSCLNDQTECSLKGVTFRVRAFCEMNKVLLTMPHECLCFNVKIS